MKFDPELTRTLRERLGGLDVSGFVAPTEAQTRVAEDVRDVLRPSRMHTCARALSLTLRALPFESAWSVESLTAVNYGAHVHRKIQAALPNYRHEIQVTGPWLRGSLDSTDRLTVLDWKTINHKGFQAVVKAGKPKDDHGTQAAWYAKHSGARRAGVVYVGKPKDGSLPESLDPEMISAYSGDIEDIPHVYDIKAHAVLTHHEAGTLPEYQAIPECRWCPMAQACHSQPDMVLPDYGKSKIVGSTMAGPERLAAFVALAVGDRLSLIWEPSNEFGPRMSDDPTQAAAVMVLDPRGAQVGYLPATGSPTASIVARHLRAGGKASAVVIECTGGGEGQNHGRNVEICLEGAGVLAGLQAG